MCSGVLTSHFSDYQLYYTTFRPRTFQKNNTPAFYKKCVNHDTALNKLNEEFNEAFDVRLLSTVDNACPNANYSILGKILIESFETKIN